MLIVLEVGGLAGSLSVLGTNVRKQGASRQRFGLSPWRNGVLQGYKMKKLTRPVKLSMDVDILNSASSPIQSVAGAYFFTQFHLSDLYS